MTTTYTLIGPVSNNTCLVQVHTVYANQHQGTVSNTQMLTLPSEDAFALAAAMGDELLEAQLIKQYPANGWIAHANGNGLTYLANKVSQASQQHTKWLGHTNLKYINIRVDMRTGDFNLSDSQGHEAKASILQMLDVKV